MRSELRHMARAGKTFFFSSWWLPDDVRGDAAIAYSFCRVVDDLADETSLDGRSKLEAVGSALAAGNRDEPLTRGVLGLIDRYPSIQAPLVELVRACSEDGPGIRVASAADLVRYAEGVAGTVGRMMYPLLGGVEPEGARYAEALGVAMQCTNITRDVLCDAAGDRVYLPNEWLDGADVGALVRGEPNIEAQIVHAVQKVLELAAERYTFGLEGLPFLRADCRRAIEIAARCYEEIGRHVVRDGHLVRRRAVVSLPRKIAIAVRVYCASVVQAPRELVVTK